MKRNVLFGSMLVAVLSVGLGAQGGQMGTSQPQSGRAKQSDDMKKGGDDMVTVTGCLQAAEGAGTASAVAGTTGGSSAVDPMKADHFILANVTRGAGGAMSQAAKPSDTSAAADMDKEYNLSGGKKDELRQMVNNQVEIHGKLDRRPGAGTTSTGNASDSGTTGSAMSTGSRAPANKMTGRTLEIASIRSIASSCK